jgi:hypothetical protein
MGWANHEEVVQALRRYFERRRGGIQGEERRTWYSFPVKFCRVWFKESEKVEHTLEMYEALGLAGGSPADVALRTRLKEPLRVVA